MKIISLINLKGGVGKTTTAVEMGYILHHKYGYRVLMVDNDKQGNLSRALGAYKANEVCRAARLLRGDPISSLDIQTGKDGCGIIDANMTLLTAAWKLTQAGVAPGQFKSLVQARSKDGQPYDYIIIDNPPDLGINVINALMVTNDVIIPTKIDQWALEGLDIIQDQITEIKQVNPGICPAKALVTMYHKTPACDAGLEWLRDNGYRVFGTLIRQSEKAAESTFAGRPIQEYSPRSAAAVSYRRFVAEYLRRDER